MTLQATLFISAVHFCDFIPAIQKDALNRLAIMLVQCSCEYLTSVFQHSALSEPYNTSTLMCLINLKYKGQFT